MESQTVFRPQFTKIKDISNRRRLPRLGKIRLGIKMISEKTGKEYPKETSYFVCPPEVEKIYGKTPIEIEVMFPLNDIEAIFPQRYVWFGSSKGIKCIGDGEHAMRIEEPDGKRYEEMMEKDCPCDLLDNQDSRLKCTQRASLFVMLPKVNVGGIYQIDLGSYHSIVDVNSGLDYIQAMVGRFAFIPLKLRRVARETHGSGRKETHYTLMVFLEGDIDFVNSLRESTNRILSGPKYALPAPVMENPAFDDGAVIELEKENGLVTEEAQKETKPQTSDLPTQEEEMAAIKERGMVTGETPQQMGKNTDVEKIIAEIAKFPTTVMLLEWFNANSKQWKKDYPDRFAEIMKSINKRLADLKTKK